MSDLGFDYRKFRRELQEEAALLFLGLSIPPLACAVAKLVAEMTTYGLNGK
jgi:hypothetical protein